MTFCTHLGSTGQAATLNGILDVEVSHLALSKTENVSDRLVSKPVRLPLQRFAFEIADVAAPIPHSLIVFTNLVVAVAITALQVVVLISAAVFRGANLHASLGAAWFVAAAALLAVGMYGVSETLANRIPTLEEFTGALPALAIVPFFFAGSLFPIATLPGLLTDLARVLPLTHALALMRYGLLDNATGLHDIWGMTDPSAMATLSLTVVAAFAALLTVVSIPDVHPFDELAALGSEPIAAITWPKCRVSSRSKRTRAGPGDRSDSGRADSLRGVPVGVGPAAVKSPRAFGLRGEA